MIIDKVASFSVGKNCSAIVFFRKEDYSIVDWLTSPRAWSPSWVQCHVVLVLFKMIHVNRN